MLQPAEVHFGCSQRFLAYKASSSFSNRPLFLRFLNRLSLSYRPPFGADSGNLKGAIKYMIVLNMQLLHAKSRPIRIYLLQLILFSINLLRRRDIIAHREQAIFIKSHSSNPFVLFLAFLFSDGRCYETHCQAGN